MLNREQYQGKAVECVRTVERMRDPAERAKLLEIAKAYINLSRYVAARYEHGTAAHDGGHLADS